MSNDVKEVREMGHYSDAIERAEGGTALYDVTVKLTGTDGNAFAILGRVQAALRNAGAGQDAIREFLAEAKSGDYDHLLRTCMKYVNVE